MNHCIIYIYIYPGIYIYGIPVDYFLQICWYNSPQIKYLWVMIELYFVIYKCQNVTVILHLINSFCYISYCVIIHVITLYLYCVYQTMSLTNDRFCPHQATHEKIETDLSFIEYI